jgi:BirA family biotin operon repressor/biotin-[acetyl-CoA-carboxylase] ligase
MAEDPLLAPPTADRLTARLATRWLGRAYEWRDVCASTSDLAAARGRAGAPAGFVVAADAQTAGRGRLGRRWHSPAGESLYLSLLLRPSRPPVEVPPITLLVGGAIAEAIAALGVTPRLKWPNDVELVEADGRRRKLAGILTEMSSAGERVEQVVVGIGINVNGTEFPDDIAARATSLRRALGRPLDRAEVLAAVLSALEARCDDFDRRGPSAAVEAFAPWAAFPDRCRVAAPGAPGGAIEGVALGLDPDGALRFQDDGGTLHRVISGEVLPT